MIASAPQGAIWLDGRWLPWAEAVTHVMTHTLHYGLGAFEGVRAYAGRHGVHLFRLRDHTRRLLESARILKIAMPFDAATLERVQVQAVARNALGDAYVRPLLFLGPEKRGIDPTGAATHVAVAAWAWPGHFVGDALERGIRLRTASIARHHPAIHLCRAKSVATYTNSILALREARAEGRDDALLLDTDGCVAEASGANVFVVRDGVLLEPDSPSALDGITRRTVRTLATGLGLEQQRRRVTRDDAWIADEVFLCGTAAEITPVVEVDRRRIGDGTPGPITRALQARYLAAVRGKSHPQWLTRAEALAIDPLPEEIRSRANQSSLSRSLPPMRRCAGCPPTTLP
jgi:branched-chain amino acid aminotransferase